MFCVGKCSLIPLAKTEFPCGTRVGSWLYKTCDREEEFAIRISVPAPIGPCDSCSVCLSSAETRIMRKSTKQAIMFFLFSLLHSSVSMDNNIKENAKYSRAQSKVFTKHPSGGLVSFNSDDSKLQIDWAVTIPFISIPIERKIGENGETSPLLQINTKGLGIVGLITTLFSVISPLFSKKHPQYNYRSEDNGHWLQMGSTINEIIFGNNYVAPCMQRVVCSIVSVATHSENPTSADKIVDGLSSHKWFKNVTNGTIIQDAVAAGRKGNHDCGHIYKDCSITPKLLSTMMNEFGIL